jgi:hypothetical protein
VAKLQRPIASEDICHVFNDACVRELASELPAGADLERFGEGVRAAARIYARDARIPTANELRAEIAKLQRAADRERHELVATLIECLTPRAHRLLNAREARPSISIALPSPDLLRDPTERDAACASVARLCEYGGWYVEGRRRPSGKRSRPGWRPLLHAPEPRRHFPKRDAERDFVIWLALAWHGATGKAPPRTADSRNPGPFARVVCKCLRLVGAGHVNAVELINELHRRRRVMTGERPKGLTE